MCHKKFEGLFHAVRVASNSFHDRVGLQRVWIGLATFHEKEKNLPPGHAES